MEPQFEGGTPRLDLRRRHAVETPEHVTIDFELAGVGSRVLAAILDAILLAAWTLLVILTAAVLGGLGVGGSVVGIFLVVVLSLSYAGYFILYEGLRNGQTPGKRRLGIRVVGDTGHSVTFGAAVIRNVLRLADILPPPTYLLGGVMVVFQSRGQRLGDLAAGTIVVRDRPATEGLPELTLDEVPAVLEFPELEDAEYHLLRQYQDRQGDLAPTVRERLAGQLATRLAGYAEGRQVEPQPFLRELFLQETARREGALAVRGQGRGPAKGGSTAERFVARQRPRWDAFAALADRASRAGLDAFRAEELPAFAARYRELASDLARARTYGVSDDVILRLERLVSAGHNALYREPRRPLRQLWGVVFRSWPAAVLEAWPAVVVAFLVFAVPAAVGFRILREAPERAETLLPEAILRRAAAGAQRQAEGRKYFQASAGERPVVATYIIVNNVRVAVACFAGGIFVGVGSLVLLAYNGLALGAFAGHFANQGLFRYLLEFIIGHGVLELFAIWLAGAAGFLLGKSILAPGRLRRSDALVQSGRLAIRLVGAATVCLVVAGLIEGLLSAGEQDLTYRAAISGASVVFLVLYLVNGRAGRADRPVTRVPG